MWSAPGRVNLIGEHTDYNDGLVLPFALPHRIAAAASPRTDGVLTTATLGFDGVVRRGAPAPVASLRPGTVRGWSAYVAGVAWALAERGLVSGADIVLAGDLPTGAGLSSSAAVECAVALALLDLHGVAEKHPLPEIARIAQRAENAFVGVPTGVLDQTASLCCRAGHALFFDVRSGERRQIPFDAGEGGLTVLVIDTRTRHALAGSAYADRRSGCERAATALGVPALRDVAAADLGAAAARLPGELAPLVRHVVTENERVRATVALLEDGKVAEIGPALDASHESLRTDYRVSCAELDLAVDAARSAGALGARMTGGGFGGCAIALVGQGDRARVEHEVRAAFGRRGLRAPGVFDAVPSPGARRDA